jgi:hypothetical protein
VPITMLPSTPKEKAVLARVLRVASAISKTLVALILPAVRLQHAQKELKVQS